jgi:hypothetical protein
MASKVCGAFVASLGAFAIVLSVNAAEAASRGGARGAFAAAPAGSHAHFPGAFRHRHRFGPGFGGFFWPGDYYNGYNGPDGEPLAGFPQPPASNFSSTDVVPWDWAHRLPPMVNPSDRPYVPSCTAESVTVPGRDGGEHTVNVTRCY